jgi:glutathione S-transferase
MAIELFVFPPSPRAFKVLAVANHLALPYVTHLVDLGKGAQRGPDFVALNPNMRMPALRDGDYVLWESNAILQYLALRCPDSGLLPLDERRRLDVTRWQFWDLAHWDAAGAIYMFENVVKPMFRKSEPDPAALERGAEGFHRSAKVLDAQLAGRRWITGDALTVADFSIGALLNHTAAARLPVEEYPAIRRWYAGLAALPAWQRTLGETAPL